MKCKEKQKLMEREQKQRRKELYCFWSWPIGHCYHWIPSNPKTIHPKRKCCGCKKEPYEGGSCAGIE